MVSIGNFAKDFTLKDQNNNDVTLSNFKGKKIALYFYPKDDTPGCKKEACSFRDNYSKLIENNIVVIGISNDDIESHKKFVDKYNLPFILLADINKEVVNLYEVFKEKNLYGKKSMGIVRTTFLIDENFKIVHIFKKVKTDVHADEVLEKFNKLEK